MPGHTLAIAFHTIRPLYAPYRITFRTKNAKGRYVSPMTLVGKTHQRTENLEIKPNKLAAAIQGWLSLEPIKPKQRVIQPVKPSTVFVSDFIIQRTNTAKASTQFITATSILSYAKTMGVVTIADNHVVTENADDPNQHPWFIIDASSKLLKHRRFTILYDGEKYYQMVKKAKTPGFTLSETDKRMLDESVKLFMGST